jgi:integrase
MEGMQLPKHTPRDRVLTDAELKAIWNSTGDGKILSNIIRLLILTGQRRGEIAQLIMDKRQRDNDTEGTDQEWPRTHVSMRELRRRIALANETMSTPRALLSRAWVLDAIQRLDEKASSPSTKN